MALQERRDELARTRVRLGEAEGFLGLEHLRSEKDRLEAEMSDPELWTRDPEKARHLGAQLATTNDDLGALDTLRTLVEDAETLYELGMEEGDDSVESELDGVLAEADKRLEQLELRSLFSGEYDASDAFVELNVGEGGVDAQDWTEMMFRMYLRWAADHGFTTEVTETIEGNEAGLSSAAFHVRGRYAYGWLCSERGVHRLVRMSPFDGQGRRQTSFCAVQVTPFMEEVPDVVIEEKDLRVDTYRATGAGGQHINTTDSAVRITHIPTGIVVSCQNQRSQIQNRAFAMQTLAVKLAERAREEREAHLSSVTGPQLDAARGSQIRSYVLAPYQMVKDLRSAHETAKVSDVLDGELDDFMEAWLRWRRTPVAG